MPGGESGVAKCFQGDPSQRDVDPEIVVARLQRESKRVACLLGVAGFPEFHAFLIVELGLSDASGMDQFEARHRARDRCEPDGSRDRGRPPPFALDPTIRGRFLTYP